MALGEPPPARYSATRGCWSATARCPSRSATLSTRGTTPVRLFGVDAIRYYVLHEMPFANDGVISYELICERIT